MRIMKTSLVFTITQCDIFIITNIVILQEDTHSTFFGATIEIFWTRECGFRHFANQP